MNIAPYAEQAARWPTSGKVVLAHFDDDTITVYQAYSPAIAVPSVAAQRLCGAFSLGRMSWIKPNFLWMMYRSGWATKEGQEHVLAIRMTRSGFDEILGAAVASSYRASGFGSHEDWQAAVARSDVRLQWDPDHGPGGQPLDRRAIQLGLRGEALRRYVQEWTVSIEDLTPFVAEQRAVKRDHAALLCPVERPYPVSDAIARRLGMIEPARFKAVTFSNGEVPVRDREVREVEGRIGLVLPEVVRDLYERSNGGQPRPYVFENDDIDTVVAEFLPLSGPRRTAPDTYASLVLEKKLVPAHFFPFAVDGGGDYFFVDCRRPDAAVHLFRSDAADPGLVDLNVSFTEFWDRLEEE